MLPQKGYSIAKGELSYTIENFGEFQTCFFVIQLIYHQVAKVIKHSRNECWNGYDNLPGKYLKLAVNKILSSFAHNKEVLKIDLKIYF